MKKRKLHPTETPELITPLLNITPPPPPIHLSKNSRLKYLFKTSISRFVLLGITTMLVIVSCGNEDTSSTSPSLTSLTYLNSKINATQGNEISNITPTIIPQDATVEYTVKPPLPAGLKLNPKSGTISGTPINAYMAAAVYTVTATGTSNYVGTASADITITVGTLSTRIEISTVAKANPAEDKRYHYVAFTIQADGTSSMGRHKFALSLKTNPTPAVQEMNDGNGVYRIVNHIEKRVLLSYTLGSGISDLMTNANYLNKIIKHGDQIGGTAADVDSYLLSPGTEYILYALKDGGSSVEELYDLTTDSFDKTSIFTGEDRHLDIAAGGEYMIDLNDAVFVFPISFIVPSLTAFYTYQVSKGFNQSFLVFSFNNGRFIEGSELVLSEGTILVSSRSVEGGDPQVSMGNTNIAIWYLLLPINVVETGMALPLLKENSELFTITPTLDQ